MKDLSTFMKKCGVVLLVLLLALLPVGCASNEILPYEVPENPDVLAGGVVAKNDRYTLTWDDVQKCILLEDNLSGHIWSNIAYSHYAEDYFDVDMNSPVFIQYYDMNTGSVETLKGSLTMDDGLAKVEQVENGVRIWLYFTDAEITLPITFTLREDSVQATVDTSLVVESGMTRLISVTMAPFFCSVKNTTDKNSYLFVPAGSGALMYTGEDVQEISRLYRGEVYGADRAGTRLENNDKDVEIRLPMYGVKDGDNALCAIIENGAEAAVIEGEAGNYINGYSEAYCVFYVRGYDETLIKGEQTGGVYYKEIAIYAKELSGAEYTVGYYPLEGADANYGGMAKTLRNYLQKNGGLKGGKTQQTYRLNMLGGSVLKTSFLGFPTTELQEATTFAQAQAILADIIATTGKKPEVMLQGFGTSGIDVGVVAGGLKFGSVFGSAKQQKALEAYCKGENISLFTDFDLVQFGSSGKGYSFTFDSAKSANLQAARFFPTRINMPTENGTLIEVALLKRSLLGELANKLNKFTNDRVSGISLNSLGNMVYSDYNDPQYYAQGNMGKQVQEIIQLYKESGHAIAFNDPNAYAAVLADSIGDTPLTSGNYTMLNETVPVYAMVYRGYVPLYSTPINLAGAYGSTLMSAVAAGVAPSFTVCESCDIRFVEQQKMFFSGSVYANNKQKIVDTVKETAAFYEALGNAQLVAYEQVDVNVTRSLFSNDIEVIVNHSDEAVTVNGETIEGYDFVYRTYVPTVQPETETEGEQA